MSKKIEAKIIADSINEMGTRIITYVLTYPRFIHSELMTHRVFSRNSASSRAIPFKKMVEMCENDPFIPIAWQKDHSGMQGVEYFEEDSLRYIKSSWLTARDYAVQQAKRLNGTHEVTKQLCNRLLEPFMWHTVIVTSTEWENFFELRCPKYYYELENSYFRSKKDWISKWDSCFENSIHYEWSDINWLKLSQSGAEIHIQALAESMWDAKNESTPKYLEPGQAHIPFGDNMNYRKFYELGLVRENEHELSDCEEVAAKIAVARCARLSYMTFEGEIDYLKDIQLYNRLYESKHMSPFEHVAICPNFCNDPYEEGFTAEDLETGDYWSGNFRNWIQWRQII